MLPERIRQAVAAGKFNIYCAGHVEDVMEILSSLPRGKLNKDGYFSKSSFNGRIQRRIEALQQLRKKFKEPDKSVTAWWMMNTTTTIMVLFC